MLAGVEFGEDLGVKDHVGWSYRNIFEQLGIASGTGVRVELVHNALESGVGGCHGWGGREGSGEKWAGAEGCLTRKKGLLRPDQLLICKLVPQQTWVLCIRIC